MRASLLLLLLPFLGFLTPEAGGQVIRPTQPNFFAGPFDPGTCREGDFYYNENKHAYSICGAAAALTKVGGGGVLACSGSPGNTVGGFMTLCQTAAGAVYACNNAAGCTVAVDWVSQKGLTAPVANASLANPAITVNGVTCTLGSTCSPGLGAYRQTFTAQTSVTLTHNLGTLAVLTKCYDNGTPAQEIGYSTLQLTDTNNATVTFSVSQTGSCVVTSGGGAQGPTGATGPSGGANTGCPATTTTVAGWVALECHTASTSAQLDFTTCISGTFDDYRIEMINLVFSTSNQPGFLMSTNGGSTYDTGANYGFAGSSNLGTSSGGVNVTALSFWSSALVQATNTSFNGVFELWNPGGANYKALTGRFSLNLSGTGLFVINYTGQYQSTTAVNAFRLIPSSGNITSGIVRCYGVQH